MQQLSRRTLSQSSVANLFRGALISHESALSSLAVSPGSFDTFGSYTKVWCAGRSLSCQAPHRLLGGRYSPINAQAITSKPFATKAEEYDLIVAEAGLVRIEGYDGTGFIVNDVQVQGAVFCLGDLFMMWNLKNWHDLTPDSLSMLQLFKPAPDLVIIGCGLHSQMVPPDLQMYFRKHRIAYEAIDTANAVSTFNILNQEGRKVAGVLLPAGSN